MSKDTISRSSRSRNIDADTLGSLQQHTEERIARERQFKELSALARDQTETIEQLRSRVNLLEKIDSVRLSPPDWSRKPIRKGSTYSSIPTLFLSDLHLDEIVRPEEIEGYNCFNREIALKRLKRTVEKTILVLRQYFAGMKYDGMMLFLGGDVFSGNIHDELIQTNADTLPGSLDYWADPLAAVIGSLQEEFERIHVAGVVGNHGRNTRKPRAKFRARDNWDWLLYRMLVRHFKGNDRVTFQIPESSDTLVQIYTTRYNLTHGDQFKGGTGIAGMLSPLMLGSHRKSRRAEELQNPFDWLVMGHWHEYWLGKGIIVNGSLKGYDEYAYVSNFLPGPPTQALFVTTPEHGLTFTAPIFPMDRDSEGW